MKILIAGNGTQSLYIINSLLDKKHQVTVLNKDSNYCQQLADQYEELNVLIGNTDISILEEIRTQKFDMAIAMSSFDSENFVICELCKNVLHIQNTVAIVSCPHNTDIFKKSGVTGTIDLNDFILSCIGSNITNIAAKTARDGAEAGLVKK